jgi:hypothetical protein
MLHLPYAKIPEHLLYDSGALPFLDVAYENLPALRRHFPY